MHPSNTTDPIAPINCFLHFVRKSPILCGGKTPYR